MHYLMITILSDKMNKVLDKGGQIAILQCFGLQMGYHEVKEDYKGLILTVEIVSADLQVILQEFKDVFKEPDQLPS